MKKLFYNAKFYSLDENNNIYNAILCEKGYITDVFIGEPPNIDCQKINLNNSFVYPGFIDSHTHSFEGALYQQGANLNNCYSIEEVLCKIKETIPVSDMIFAWQFDENQIKEKRFPSRYELDSVYPNYPLLLRRIDGHSCAINSKAEKMITDKYKKDIVFTDNSPLRGDLNDIAAHTFHQNLKSESIINCYKLAEKIALQNGHTTIHTMIGDAKNNILHYPIIKEHLKDFSIDFILYPQSFDIEKAKLYNSDRIGGCILADGSFGSYTAGLSKPYQDSTSTGLLYQTQEFWDDFIINAHKNNLQTGVHCIGDLAIMQIVNAVNKAQKAERKDLRHQIIHCELVRDDMISEMQNAQVTAVMQPMFDALWGGQGGFYNKVLGNERLNLLNRFKTLSEAGITVAGSSDWYITDLSALKGINAIVNHHNPNERLNPQEAIKIYTRNPAKLSYEENKKGMIKKNFLADLTCLDKDILIKDNISTASVLKTIKQAEFVYE